MMVGKWKENSNVRGRMSRRIMIAMTIMPLLFRHRVVTAASPGMTAGDALQAKPRPATGSVKDDRLKKILGTGRSVTAAAARATGGMNHGREEFLVAADDQTNQGLHDAPSEFRLRRIPARLAARLQSSCNSRRDASEARQRAMVTIQ